MPKTRKAVTVMFLQQIAKLLYDAETAAEVADRVECRRYPTSLPSLAVVKW